MYFRNVWYAAELISCKPALLKRPLENAGCVRLQLRSSFHRRRGTTGPTLEPDPLIKSKFDNRPLFLSDLAKPLLFTLGVSTASLAACVIWEYETLRSHAANIFKKPGAWLHAHHKKVFANNKELGPIGKWWKSLKDSEKVFYPILVANVLVFGAWRVKAWQPIMIKYFCSNPSGGAVCLPMLLSTFSHYAAIHLAANMYVLYSFMPAAVAALGKEQFVAMYLSGGVVSSFASFMYKVLLNQPGLSLGASGAIMSVLAYVCVQYPDTKLSIIFLPMYSFAASSAIKVIMSFDLAGVVMGWKFFDHAAHLGGALFGIAWCYWGSSHLWGNRDKFLQYYHVLRKNDTSR